MRIRRMKKRHMKQCIDFVVNVLHEPLQATRDDIKEFRRWDSDEVLLLVAEEEEDKRFCGFAGVVYEAWNRTGLIQWIGLTEDQRGAGLGSQMLMRMVRWVGKCGGRKIYVSTDVDASGPIAFYEKNGFAQEAVFRDWYFDGGDAVFLSRRTDDLPDVEPPPTGQ